MDKDRIKGAAKQAKGAVKVAVGKVLGDAKLQASGRADKLKGKMQNAVGGNDLWDEADIRELYIERLVVKTEETAIDRHVSTRFYC